MLTVDAEIPIYEAHSCKYFSEYEIFNKLNSLETKQFSIFSLNIQSLQSKWHEFNNFLNTSLGTSIISSM